MVAAMPRKSTGMGVAFRSLLEETARGHGRKAVRRGLETGVTARQKDESVRV
ncbi:hypothetical protein GCM10017589_55620 [Streptomyces poonensis]|nr:hypothetical protein GCM10017589_55620 [Streptomyces poonensis]